MTTKKPLSGAPANRLIAGPGGGPESRPLRFVLSKKNFQPLQGKISKQEVEDTLKLLEELRRRIGTFSQIHSLTQRSSIWKALAPEFDELYLSTTLLGEANPSGALKEIEQKRKIFQKI